MVWVIPSSSLYNNNMMKSYINHIKRNYKNHITHQLFQEGLPQSAKQELLQQKLKTLAIYKACEKAMNI